MRGDASAVAAFVGSARDLAQESVLSDGFQLCIEHAGLYHVFF
jgi:hypothetical protein